MSATAWSKARLVGSFLFVQYVVPRPEAVSSAGWRLLGLFLACIGGLILQPIPDGGLVLIAVTLARHRRPHHRPGPGRLRRAHRLAGDGRLLHLRALLNTGLARRIALFFVRLFGKSSLGVSYALALSDMVLAGIIPSNAARSGGVVLPIVRSISELYGSYPGETARKLGAFLMLAVYQSICITAAMFFTGQASNPLAAQIAADQFGYSVTWGSWFLAGLVPGLCSLALVPVLISRFHPPEVRHTPRAAEFATSELQKMGPMKTGEWIVLGVFLTVCTLWITAPWHGLDLAVSALLGACALLACGVITWHDVKNEHAAWDIFVWYGGLVRLGKALGEAGVTSEFAQAVGGLFSGMTWVMLFLGALLIYFYAHYFFASITAHILSMYAPFIAVLAAAGAPLGLMVYAFACFSNFAAGLTNYGTTPSPMYFAHGYVDLARWWKIGFLCSIANLAIWGTVGFAWWKLLGYW
jgi:divalent anion:Na+ symporter, DASS family